MEADHLRTQLGLLPQEGQIKTPDEIVLELDWAKFAAAKSAAIIRDAERTAKALRRRYDARFSIVVKRSTAKASEMARHRRATTWWRRRARAPSAA